MEYSFQVANKNMKAEKIINGLLVLTALVAIILPLVKSFQIEHKVLSFLIAAAMLLQLVKNRTVRYTGVAICLAMLLFIGFKWIW